MLDHHGRVLQFTDEHDQTFTDDRKLELDSYGNYSSDNGAVLVSTTPDPDDFSNRTNVASSLQVNRSLAPQVTVFQYDALRNVTQQTLPDLATSQTYTRSWSGHTLTRPTSFTNELGQDTDYTVQTNGDITQEDGDSPAGAPNRSPGSAAGFQNPLRKLDVDRDGGEDDDDLQNIVDEVDSDGIGNVNPNKAPGTGFVDTTGDGVLSSRDALLMVNYLNSEAGNGGSPASSSYTAPPDQVTDTTYTNSADLVPEGLVEKIEVTTGRGTLTTEYDYYDGTETDGASQAVKDARFGLLESITYAAGTALAKTVSYEYDANGNKTKFTDEIGRETLYVYDNLDRLVKVTTEDPDGAGSEQPLITETKYDAFGNVASTEITNYNPIDLVTTTHTTCYYYETMDRLEWQVDPHPGQNTTDSSCDITSLPADWTAAQSVTGWVGRPITYNSSYDGNGNLESTTDPLERTTSFEYDALDRRTKVVQTATASTGSDASLLSVTGEVLESGGPVTTFIYQWIGQEEGNWFVVVAETWSFLHFASNQTRMADDDSTGLLPCSPRGFCRLVCVYSAKRLVRGDTGT